MKDSNSFQMKSKEGDIVRMPNGTVGIISQWGIVCGGNVKEVQVYPLTNWLHRLWLTLTLQTWYYDDDINKLTLLN